MKNSGCVVVSQEMVSGSSKERQRLEEALEALKE
tara:strand:- start:169 stop:270 length:102 start_codon:yes stop_codon:yes gene_type:complete